MGGFPQAGMGRLVSASGTTLRNSMRMLFGDPIDRVLMTFEFSTKLVQYYANPTSVGRFDPVNVIKPVYRQHLTTITTNSSFKHTGQMVSHVQAAKTGYDFYTLTTKDKAKLEDSTPYLDTMYPQPAGGLPGMRPQMAQIYSGKALMQAMAVMIHLGKMAPASTLAGLPPQLRGPLASCWAFGTMLNAAGSEGVEGLIWVHENRQTLMNKADQFVALQQKAGNSVAQVRAFAQVMQMLVGFAVQQVGMMQRMQPFVPAFAPVPGQNFGTLPHAYDDFARDYFRMRATLPPSPLQPMTPAKRAEIAGLLLEMKRGGGAFHRGNSPVQQVPETYLQWFGRLLFGGEAPTKPGVRPARRVD